MENFTEHINQANTIAITGHIHPDGDCIGSCLGLRQYILDNFKNKQVDVFLEPIAPEFHFLPGADTITSQCIEQVYDLFCVLDCSTTDRFVPFETMSRNAKKMLCIDHHLTNQGLGDVCYVNAMASATCEVLCQLFEAEKITSNCAQCLYTGIVHDTGVFKHSNTTKDTMTYAGMLLEKGVNSSKIIDETFYQKTYIQNLALGQALLNSKLTLDGEIILSHLTADELHRLEATPADVNGIIDQLRVTEGVEVAIFTYPLETGGYKVSMRSNGKVDVSIISQDFNGGGHIRAAGYTFFGELSELTETLLSKIKEQL